MASEGTPAWLGRVLAQNYEFLETKVKAAWLPALHDVRFEAKAISGRPSKLGCGLHGCVLETLDPGVVLKATDDESEAEFAAQHARTLVVPIVTDYRMVVALNAERKGQRLYLLWREAASDVGGLGKRSARAREAIDDQHRAAQDAYELLWTGAGSEEVGPALEAWASATHEMARVPELAFVASGMLRVYQEQGIFFGDIHEGNLGVVTREGKRTWVITDPGHIAVIARSSPTPAHANPYQQGIGSWKAANIFDDSINARMLRQLWLRGHMTQAEFMNRYHRKDLDLTSERRDSRLTDGKTAFLNNLGRYVAKRSYASWRDLTSETPATHPVLEHERQQKRFTKVIWQRSLDAAVRQEYGLPASTPLRGNLLVWVGPSVPEWLAAMTPAELQKAIESMESQMVRFGNQDDAHFVEAIRATIAQRPQGASPKASSGLPRFDLKPNPEPRPHAEIDDLIVTWLQAPTEGNHMVMHDAIEQSGFDEVDYLAKWSEEHVEEWGGTMLRREEWKSTCHHAGAFLMRGGRMLEWAVFEHAKDRCETWWSAQMHIHPVNTVPPARDARLVGLTWPGRFQFNVRTGVPEHDDWGGIWVVPDGGGYPVRIKESEQEAVRIVVAGAIAAIPVIDASDTVVTDDLIKRLIRAMPHAEKRPEKNPGFVAGTRSSGLSMADTVREIRQLLIDPDPEALDIIRDLALQHGPMVKVLRAVSQATWDDGPADEKGEISAKSQVVGAGWFDLSARYEAFPYTTRVSYEIYSGYTEPQIPRFMPIIDIALPKPVGMVSVRGHLPILETDETRDGFRETKRAFDRAIADCWFLITVLRNRSDAWSTRGNLIKLFDAIKEWDPGPTARLELVTRAPDFAYETSNPQRRVTTR